jgi:hypothetical protein
MHKQDGHVPRANPVEKKEEKDEPLQSFAYRLFPRCKRTLARKGAKRQKKRYEAQVNEEQVSPESRVR